MSSIIAAAPLHIYKIRLPIRILKYLLSYKKEELDEYMNQLKLTVDPQSPSPTLWSHSLRVSFIARISVAAASMAASSKRPCSLSSKGRFGAYKNRQLVNTG